MTLSEQSNESDAVRRTAVVGAGSIGAAFTVVFVSAQRQVSLFDPDADALQKAQASVERSLYSLDQHGLLKETVPACMARLRLCSDLPDAVKDADWVHECAPERVEIKAQLFAELGRLTEDDCIIASASSAIPVSQFASDLHHRDRCLVAHPGNPPFLLRLLELVPAEFTAVDVLARATAFAEHVGLHPIHVRREIEGFVFNRLQGALLREAYCLVRDGVASVDDIDTLVREGLGLRWSVIGPFETVDLNTRGGIASHASKLGAAYARMGRERGQNDPWTDDLVADVTAQRRARLSMDDWGERVAWRDRRLMRRLSDNLGAESDG